MKAPLFKTKKAARIAALAMILAAAPLLGLAAPQQARALFFGYDQQAEAYKHQGDYAYETQNYPSASNYFNQAINILPYDAYQAKSGLYYSLALADDVSGSYDRATADWQHAKECFDQLLQAAPSNPQARINTAWATQESGELGNLVKWRATCDPNTSDYMANVGVRRWPANKFPLRIFVDESSGRGFGSGSRGTIEQAASQWVAADPTRLRITEVQDINQADIIYQRPQAGEVAQGSGGRTTYDDFVDGRGSRWIKHAYVKLTCATVDYNNMNAAQKNELYNLALHESGHAFGIDGHSPSGLDVMYWKSPLLRLSSRDMATIVKIYQ